MGRKKKTAEDYNQEYAGKVYKYVRIDEYAYTGKKGIVYFWCACLRCGKKFDKPILLNSLKSGATTSCGKCAINNPEAYYKEYIGKIYNEVRIDAYAYNDKDNHPYFWCTCLKCGSKFDNPIDLYIIKSRKAKNCNKCIVNNPKAYYREYIGKIYNYIRIDEYSHMEGKLPYFWCTCLRCGEKFEHPIQLASVKSGHTKSCGNCVKNNPEAYYQEYIGKVYGYTRIDRYSHNDKNKQAYFWCTCLRCGEKFDKPVALGSIKSNSSKSCGKCSVNNPKAYYQEYISKIYNYVRIDEYAYTGEKGRVYFWCTCLRCGEKINHPIRIDQLKSGHVTSCGCRTESKGEEKIRTMLEKMEVKFEQEYTGFTDMKDKGVLKCDFWLPGFNRVIEFDGELHYQNREDYGDDLRDVQRRDQIKNQYCWDHDIDIVRIPYWEMDNFTMEDLVNKYSKYLVKKD